MVSSLALRINEQTTFLAKSYDALKDEHIGTLRFLLGLIRPLLTLVEKHEKSDEVVRNACIEVGVSMDKMIKTTDVLIELNKLSDKGGRGKQYFRSRLDAEMEEIVRIMERQSKQFESA